jgi:conjugative transfer signal peptidase TraF
MRRRHRFPSLSAALGSVPFRGRPDRRRQAAILAAASLAMLGVGFATIAKPVPLLVYNGSASVPLGFYRVVHDMADRPIAVGDLVLATAPEPARRLAAERGYLPANVPLVKRVAARAGDLVCADSGITVINGRVAADTLLIDGQGRPLPAWRGCRILRQGEIFLLVENVRASFDGRYFGPITTDAIIGRLVPLWTW